MGESKKYAAFSIPQRAATPKQETVTHIGPIKVSLSSGAEFAEIEYGSSFRGAQSTAPAQPIEKRAVDPIRERFFHMRSLASGISFARNDPKLFFRQAKFMEGFEDDYARATPFFMYYPCYQHMGYEQLRTYFSWRKKVRQGDMQKTSLSYIFLYIYELLSLIGADDPSDGLVKLLAVFGAFREHEPMLSNYVPKWIKDFYIYYGLPRPFADFAREHQLQAFYPELFILGLKGDDSLDILCGISAYDIAKSKFYKDGNERLLRDCYASVIDGIRALCAEKGLDIQDLMASRAYRSIPWYPFQRALYYPHYKQPDRQVELPGGQIYFCKDNRWATNSAMISSCQRDFIGYVLKKTEACLRQTVKYKHKITANPAGFGQGFQRMQALGISVDMLAAAIEQAVKNFHRNLNRTVVTVDAVNLRRIREEALGTQGKLIVEEDEPLEVSAQPPQDSQAEGWDALKDALTDMEREALRILLRGGADIKAFSDENGIMLEVLLDSINEKAADYIGDSLLEFTELYDEYADKVAEMVG